MIGRMIRVLFGFVLACLAAGATMVLFIYSPVELATTAAPERLAEAGVLALAAATQTAMFAAPFALVGAIVGEGRRIGSLVYYVLVAVAIAATGFLVQYWGEASGPVRSGASILNNYAALAFLATGVAAGFVYWLACGRSARRRGPDEPQVEVIEPPRSAGAAA